MSEERSRRSGSIGPCSDGTTAVTCECGWSTRGASYQAAVDQLEAHDCLPPPPSRPKYDPLKSLWSEIDEALSPDNARKFDGDNNYKKCLDLKTGIVGADDGIPVFVLNAKSPRSAVNNLGMSVTWNTNDRAEAAAFLRQLADKIEKGSAS
jgi:hypothetical protein